MYNDAQKRAFIEESFRNASSMEMVEYIFNLLEPIEEEWGADISTRSAEEIKDAVGRIFALREHTNATRYMYIKRYLRWCYRKHTPGATTVFEELDEPGNTRMDKMTVSDPGDLQAYLDSIFPPVEERTVDIVFRALYWMAYAGIYESDAYKIESKHVDLDNMKIIYNGREYPIYSEGYFAMMVASTAGIFVHGKSKVFPDGKKAGRSRADGDLILRCFRAQAEYTSLRPWLSRKLTEAYNSGRIDKKISYKKAMLSGWFFRARMMEMHGITPTFEREAEEAVLRTYPAASDEAMRRKKQTMSETLRDYKRWKRAWGIEQ